MPDIFDTLEAAPAEKAKDIFDQVESEPTYPTRYEPEAMVSSLEVIPPEPARTTEELIARRMAGERALGTAISAPAVGGPTESVFKGVFEKLKAAPTSQVPPSPFEIMAAGMQPGGMMLGPKVPVEIGRRARNMAVGIPEFMTSPVGATTAVLGAIVPTLVAAGYTLDTLRQMVQEAPDLYRKWPSMTNEERAGALTDVLGQAGMAALLGRATVKGVREMIPKKPIVEAPKPPVIPEVPPETAALLPKAAAEVAKPEQPAAAPPMWRGTVREVDKPESWGGKKGEKLYIPVDASGKDVEIGGKTILGTTPEEAIDLATRNVKPAAPAAQPETPDAIQERSTKAVPVVEAPGDRGAMGEGAPPPREAALPQAPAEEAARPAQSAVLLTPAVQASGQTFTGTSHAEAIITAARKGVDATQAEHVFLDAQGNVLNRLDAAKVWQAATGRKVMKPELGLQSEDLKATAPPAGPGEGVPSKTAAASAALPVTSESGGVAAPPEAARQPPASTVSVKGQEEIGVTPKTSSEQTLVTIPPKEPYLGQQFFHIRVMNKEGQPQKYQVTKVSKGNVYYRIVHEDGTLGKPPETTSIEDFRRVSKGTEKLIEKPRQDILEFNNVTGHYGFKPEVTDAEVLQMGKYAEQEANRAISPNGRARWIAVASAAKTELETRLLRKQTAQAPPTPPAPGPGMGEGPGALTAGTPPTGKAQIEQLADAFKNKAPAGQRVAQLMRGSFDYGTRIAQAKDAVSRAISGLKSSGDALWTSLTKFEKPDELLQAKGQLSAELETRGWRVRQFANDVKRAIPDVRRRAAISKWIDSGGDQATLQAGMSATKPEYRQAYADAMNLRGDDLVAAQNISNYFEARLQEAIDAGVLEHGLDDYIHRIYEKDPGLVQRASAYVQSGILSKNPSLAKKRLFQFDWEAEAAGKRPVQDFLPRVTDYETSLARAIAAREFIAKLSTMTASDGRPIIGIKGVGIPVEDPAGVRTGTLIQPKGDFKKAKDPTDPGNYRGDYQSRDYPSLRKWKWVGKDAADQDIFLQGDVAIHPEYAKRIDRLLAPSAVRKSPVGSAALGLGSTVKQTMLDFSLFHHVQIGVHAMEHRVMPWSIIKDIDFENPKVEGLLKGGVTLGGEYRGANLGEGLVGRSISRHIPGLGPVMESYHEWLFQSFIPRVKMTMALHALERNRARYAKDLASGRMTETDLNFLTAKQANAAFGELNYITMERSKTFQDMARLVLLAPDFLEARAKFAAQAFTKYGTEQRVALFLGAAALYTAARVFNKLLDDQYHFEPENLFNVVYKNNAYSLRTVQGDLLHLYDKPMQFWLSRLNPVYGRTILEAASQRDYYGRKRTPLQIAGDAVSTVVPISMRSSRERHLWESFLNGVGITARRWNDVQTAYKLASEWKTKNHIREAPGEFVYDADKDPLRPLKIALSEGDEPGSVKEIGRVLASKALTLQQMNQYFQRYSRAPFTGSMGNDRKWYASLSKDHQQTVDAARQHRQAMWTLYSRARGQYFQSLSPTPLTP